MRERDASGKLGKCLRELAAHVAENDIGSYEIVALVHAGLGETDQAFEWLQRAYDERDQGMTTSKVDPPLDPLRADPRFEELLRRMDLPT